MDGEANGSCARRTPPASVALWGLFRTPLLPGNPGFNHCPLRSPRAIISGAVPEQQGGSSEPQDAQSLHFRSPSSDVGQDQGYFWLLTSPAPSENPSPAANESRGGAGSSSTGASGVRPRNCLPRHRGNLTSRGCAEGTGLGSHALKITAGGPGQGGPGTHRPLSTQVAFCSCLRRGRGAQAPRRSCF